MKSFSITRSFIATTILLVTLLTGCTKEMGAALGSAAGSIGSAYLPVAVAPVGSSVESIGGQIGSLVGQQIAQYLDDTERKQAEKAALDALNSQKTGSGSTQTWSSKTNSGVSGGSTIVAEDKSNDGRVCRIQRNFINVRGKDIEQTDRLCRDPKSGAWVQA